MSALPLLKRARIENTTILSAIEACSKEVSNLKLAFDQRLASIENCLALITAGSNTIITRMDALENFIQNCMKSDKFRHSCCEEVLQKMNTIEEMLRNTAVTQHIPCKDEMEISNTNM
jgi:urate oxidase